MVICVSDITFNIIIIVILVRMSVNYIFKIFDEQTTFMFIFSKNGNSFVIIFPYRFCNESKLWERNYKCDFTTIGKDHLRKHIQSVHREVTYPCDECNYTATKIGYLRNHIKSTHSKAHETNVNTKQHIKII